MSEIQAWTFLSPTAVFSYLIPILFPLLLFFKSKSGAIFVSIILFLYFSKKYSLFSSLNTLFFLCTKLFSSLYSKFLLYIFCIWSKIILTEYPSTTIWQKSNNIFNLLSTSYPSILNSSLFSSKGFTNFSFILWYFSSVTLVKSKSKSTFSFIFPYIIVFSSTKVENKILWLYIVFSIHSLNFALSILSSTEISKGMLYIIDSLFLKYSV